MPKGPNGEWRPADANSSAVMAAKVATGEVQEKHKTPVENSKKVPSVGIEPTSKP